MHKEITVTMEALESKYFYCYHIDCTVNLNERGVRLVIKRGIDPNILHSKLLEYAWQRKVTIRLLQQLDDIVERECNKGERDE